jgi:hypothetical protein
MPTPIELDAPNCLYPASACSPVQAPELRSELRVEVLVVGGGYTGLSTALHLAEQGRNGGQVNAGLKFEPDTAERTLGPVFGPRLVGMALNAPRFLFALIDRLGIECEVCRGGRLLDRVGH